jgi:hypothetical protein
MPEHREDAALVSGFVGIVQARESER